MSRYGSARSRTFHSDPNCSRCKVKVVCTLDVNELRNKIPCARCVPNARTCTACYDFCEPTITFETCEHCFCLSCSHIIVSDASKRNENTISCPCRNSLPLSTIPSNLFTVYVDSRQISPAADDAITSVVDALNLKCPHCGAVFYDFDGCAALRCRCGGLFCALCMHKSYTNDEIHAHVLSCPENPNGDYYITHSQWNVHVDARRRQIFHDAFRKESPEGAVGLLLSLSSQKMLDIDVIKTAPWLVILRSIACFYAELLRTVTHKVFAASFNRASFQHFW